jgi:hypothetical protein
LLFKIQHNLVAIPAEVYLLPLDSRTRGQNTFRIPSTRKDVYRNSFFPRSIREWNNLPPAAKTASSVEEFRDTWQLTTCPVPDHVDKIPACF